MKARVVRDSDGAIRILTGYGTLDITHTQYKREFGHRVKKNTDKPKELKLFNRKE